NYGGNDAAAQAFAQKYGIPVYKFDVSDFKQCQDAIMKIPEKPGPVHILVNNAGITRDGPLHKMTPEMWGQVVATNLGSCFNMCRCVIDNMRERSFGRIVNIAPLN